MSGLGGRFIINDVNILRSIIFEIDYERISPNLIMTTNYGQYVSVVEISKPPKIRNNCGDDGGILLYNGRCIGGNGFVAVNLTKSINSF